MDVQNTIGGSLQISTDVLAKIARLAALEDECQIQVQNTLSHNDKIYLSGLYGCHIVILAVSLTLIKIIILKKCIKQFKSG